MPQITVTTPDLFHSIVQKPLAPNRQSIIQQWELNPQQQNLKAVEADLKAYHKKSQQTKTDAILVDAYATFAGSSPSINYELGRNSSPESQPFHEAFNEIKAMLSDKAPQSIMRAVFLYENAYDPSITWDGFKAEIDRMVRHIGFKMKQDKIAPNDAISKNLTLFQFFTDTLEVNYTAHERPVVSYPMFYDFEDFWGREDVRNVFVSKLIKTGTGQCHSLPLLYMILAEQIGANAHLAFSPSHSYVKFQDNAGNWHNIELTNHMMTSDQFIMYSGYVKAEALSNQLYMNPLSKSQVIAQTLNDLATSYIAKFGYDDFVKQCTNLAYASGLNSMSIHKLNFNYYLVKHNRILNQYRQLGLTRQDFEKDQEAMKAYQNLIGTQKHIEKLGYADMPAEQYEKWLNSVQEEGRKQEHRNKMRTLMGTLGNNKP